MQNIMLTALLLCLLTLSAGDYSISDGGSGDSGRVEVTGVVIGYSLLSELRLVSGRSVSWPHDVLLIRAEEESSGLRKGQYVKIRYRATAEHHEELPATMKEQGGRWRFVLTRDKGCDEVIRSFIYGDESERFEGAEKYPNLQRVRGAEGEKLPEDITLPCYSFSQGGYKGLD
jgi:hypothetical protein